MWGEILLLLLLLVHLSSTGQKHGLMATLDPLAGFYNPQQQQHSSQPVGKIPHVPNNQQQ